MLKTIAATGVAPRTVNGARAIMGAAFTFGMKMTSFSLPTDPVRDTDRRRVPPARALDFYSPDESEPSASALANGYHRPAVLARGELELFGPTPDARASRASSQRPVRGGWSGQGSRQPRSRSVVCPTGEHSPPSVAPPVRSSRDRLQG